MLPAGNNPAVAQAVDPLLAECDYRLRIGSERAVTDYRVFGVRVDIQHRREIQIDSHRGEFFSGRACDSVGELGVARFTKTRCGRKVGEWLGQTKDTSHFLINGDERGQAFAGIPKSPGQRENLRGITAIMAKEDEAPEGIVFYPQPLFP